MIDDKVKKILREGSIKVRVRRSGMLQYLNFVVKKVNVGADYFVELRVNRIIDISELQRVANEVGLPVEAENGRAFPDGMGAKDFLNF